MADSFTRIRISSSLTALRGLLMLLAGLFAILFPGAALAALVVIGGALLFIDGVLGVWSLTFGHATAKTGNYWFDVVRNVLALILGVLILISPLIATILTVTVLAYIVAFQAIIVGAMEVYFGFRLRHRFTRSWPVLLSGLLYVLFGLALLFRPLLGAQVVVTMVGILLVVFAIGLFGLAWRLRRAGV